MEIDENRKEFLLNRRDFLVKSGKILGGLFLSTSLSLIYPKKAFPNDSSIYLSWGYEDVIGQDYSFRIFFKDNAGSGVLPSEKINYDTFCNFKFPEQDFLSCDVQFNYPFSRNFVYEFWVKAYNGEGVSSSDSNHVSAECSSGYWKNYSPFGGGGRTPTGGGSRSSNEKNIENFLALNLGESGKSSCSKSVGIDKFFS